MSSTRTRSNASDFDELLLYAATAVALAATLLASGWASGSFRVGFVGAALAATGVWTSWHTRDWQPDRRWLLGIATALVAAGSLQALIRWEIAAQTSMLYAAEGDVGLTLALRMSVPLVGFSYLLVRRDALPFSLVPAITLFGLAGGRGLSIIAFGCFLLFLPAALFALAQAMLLSGLPPNWGRGASSRDRQRMRSRHWLTLGLVLAVILCLGTLIYIPAFSYGTQYYWQLALMSFGGGGMGGGFRGGRSPETSRSYSVGNGPIAPTENPVLSYEGEPAPYWRGEVFDIYNGNAWLSSDDAPRYLRAPHLVVPTSNQEAAGTTPAVHQVRAEQTIPVVIYAPGRVQKADLPPLLPSRLSTRMSLDKFGCIVGPEASFSAGEEYTITSDPRSFIPGGEASRVSASSLGELDSSYLRIPLGSRRVADLARRVTANADNSNEKLEALTSYLQQNCAYTLDAPAVASGEDAVDFFLFRSRRGYCDLFATALAVMARAAGVPTRFVTGYAGGQYDPTSGRYLLRESDAHAWVEAYVPPYGWITVDPAPAGGPAPIPPLQRVILTVRFFVTGHPALTAVLLAAVILFPIAFFLWRRHRSRLPTLSGPRGAIIVAYAKLNRLLAKRGRPRHPSQTPLEYLTALESEVGATPCIAGRSVGRVCDNMPAENHFKKPVGQERKLLPLGLNAAGRSSTKQKRTRPIPPSSLVPIRSLTAIFVQARYGPGPVTPEIAEAASQHLMELRQSLRRRR